MHPELFNLHNGCMVTSHQKWKCLSQSQFNSNFSNCLHHSYFRVYRFSFFIFKRSFLKMNTLYYSRLPLWNTALLWIRFNSRYHLRNSERSRKIPLKSIKLSSLAPFIWAKVHLPWKKNLAFSFQLTFLIKVDKDMVFLFFYL